MGSVVKKEIKSAFKRLRLSGLVAKQVSDIIPPHLWIDNPKYCGPAVQLADFWKEKFVEVASGSFNEVIIIGSIGGGKTTFANVLLMRKIYEMSCFRPIPFLFGLMEGTIISFIYFSVTLKQAMRTGYGTLIQMLDATPYFRNEFSRDTDIDSEIRLGNRDVVIYSGSTFEHQIGLNLIGAVLDEANFYRAKDPFRKAQEIYTAVANRRKSRFVVKGKDMGLSILVSSAEEPSSFVESRIRESANDPSVKVISAVGFEIRRSAYGSKTFWVFTGAEFVSPRIVDNHSDLATVLEYFKVPPEFIDKIRDLPLSMAIKELPVEVRTYFKDVPIEFRRSFEQDPVRAVKDVLGISVGSEGRLFRSIFAYEDCLTKEPSPFGKDIITLSSKDSVKIQDYFNLSFIQSKEHPRYIHVDLGTRRDRTGMASAYVSGIKDTELGPLPIVSLDFIVGFERDDRHPDDEVPIWKIREFLLWMRERGINIAKVTFDQYQSLDTLQLLKRSNFNVDRLSVDKTDEQYLNLVALYLERRLRHPENLVYRRELFMLEYDDKHKVDHPAGASKDLADAVCGAVWNATSEFRPGIHDLASKQSDFGPSIDEIMIQTFKDRTMSVRWDSWEEFFKTHSKTKKRKGGFLS